MSTAPEVVRYAPDKGASFGHALRPSPPKRAWKAVEGFLAECEDVKGPSTVTLSAYGPTQWDDAAIAEACMARTVERFGIPDFSVEGVAGRLEWNGADRFAEFRDFVLAGDPWPRTLLGPVSLRASYDFLWRDPDSVGPITTQLTGHLTEDGSLRCNLSIALERRSTASPLLWFPYQPSDPRLADLLRFVVPRLPFRISSRHFRLAIPLKNRKGYQYRRFDASHLVQA